MSVKNTVKEVFGLNENEWKVVKWFTIASVVSALTIGFAISYFVAELAQSLPQHITVYTGK